MINRPLKNVDIKLTDVKKILTLIGFILVSISGLPGEAMGADGSLSIYPQTGTFTVGSTFDVSVFLNSGGENINAVRADLKFDPEKLQVINPAKGLSSVGVWTFPPSFSNTKGEITLQGGFYGEGLNSSEGLVSVIVFEAVSPGPTEISFLNSSQILVGKKDGINILSSVNRGLYDIIPPLSTGPKIFSESHPDQNKWYRNNSPNFNWEKPEGAASFSYKLDDDPSGEPDNTVDTVKTSVSLEGTADGVSYFHLKANKGGVWGGTSHFKVMIDNVPPLGFQPYLEAFSQTAGSYLPIYFDTNDSLSGIDHYEVRIADLTDPKNTTLSGWNRQDSPFRISVQNQGIFSVMIRAFDKAGNYREEKIQINKSFTFTGLILLTGGIQIKGFFIPWWLFYILAGIILFLTAYLIFRWLKTRKQTLGDKFLKEVEEAEKEIEDVRKFREKFKEVKDLEEKAENEGKRLEKELWDKK